MKLPAVWPAIAVFAVFAAGCGGDGASGGPAASPTTPLPEAATATAPPNVTSTATAGGPSATATLAPSPAPPVVRQDIRVTRLVIPAAGIDAEVSPSQTVPFVYAPPPGCPPAADGAETLEVPNQGIATPAEALEGLENKLWIFGHSRWAGVPGLFFALQDLGPGDEVLVDGVDRVTGEALVAQRYVVTGFYLTDTDSGETFLNAADASETPAGPIVLLQTSVRERGADRPWILDRSTVLAKAENLVQGDLDDPCKYLLLFVTAEAE
ncbi:MAG: hypothetical protein V3S31_01510 [Dehalococcoidia bacterium]